MGYFNPQRPMADVANPERTVAALEACEERWPEDEYVVDLRRYYEEHGYLTTGQLNALERKLDRYARG